MMEEDAQPLEVPIIAPIKQKNFDNIEKEPLRTHYSNEFLAGLTGNPELIRNVAVVGHLHHGKTLVRPSVAIGQMQWSRWLPARPTAVFASTHTCAHGLA